MSIDPLDRFSKRADYYAKYRPKYASETLATLQTACGLTPDMVIADVGSGTGNLAEILLRNGNHVFGIEPNTDMRTTAEALLAEFIANKTFTSLTGTAEATTLPASSMDMITAGQAFDWFDPEPTKTEFRRILKKPDGWIVLVRNRWLRNTNDANRAYGGIVRKHTLPYPPAPEPNLVAFFGGGYTAREFDNTRLETLDCITGGLLSASFAPIPDSPEHHALAADLKTWFERYQQEGHIRVEIKTEVLWGKLNQDADSRG
ncbi:MAG: class I SAM-dependent methyltransferase [Anaerolineae bacterium]|nr:class I SAM-dependent methyltransferase [Anaerolineae bacterium]